MSEHEQRRASDRVVAHHVAGDETLERRVEGGHQRHLRPSFAAGLGALSEGIERLAAAWSAYHADPAEPLEASAPPAML